MLLRRLADVMMGAGLALGAVAVIGYAFDIVPALPPALLKLIIYKLLAIGAFGLIAFGAVLARIDRRLTSGRRHTQQSDDSSTVNAALPEGAPRNFESRFDSRARRRETAELLDKDGGSRGG